MKYQHKDLASGRWGELPLAEQMANIGSEVGRALKWKTEDNNEYSMRCCERALELLDLSLDSCKVRGRLKEIARVREVIADFFFGKNQFDSSADSINTYFLQFAFAARNNK